MNTKRLIQSANWVRNELLVRLAHRIRDFQQLPFYVGTNPNIEFVYRLYWGAFETIRKFPVIKNNDDNERFCAMLTDLLEDGQLVIPSMALGVMECASYYSPGQRDLDRFLNRMLRSRISRRVLAEQHLSLTEACEHDWDETMGFDDGYVGIIYVHCSAREIVSHAQKLVYEHAHGLYFQHYNNEKPPSGWKPPVIQVELHQSVGRGYQQAEDKDEIIFAYVPEHLEHILYELLSNAVRFTMANYLPENYPPIRVTVSANATDVYFRISDQGKGISKERFDTLWSYQSRKVSDQLLNFKQVHKMPTKVKERAEMASGQGIYLGMGLPLSRIFAEYWGGELQVLTMDGFGTDAYVRIPRLGTQAENLGFEKHPLYTSKKQKIKAGNSTIKSKKRSPMEEEAELDVQKQPTAVHHYRRSVEQQTGLPPVTGNGWNHSSMIRS
ncbi:uncharacterized protein BYT42DRAFT_593949 [Radiomyces spectabilis]|uniref:uncharacterized protein n=1 Tax=Radiomyces spectabilis TaxID=64574 RepID=UPI002220F3C0|nr:uncharacterized protein BYT42DRAFT_593949 [Radiomyces spectabilis]KAI8377874.1 hypothetical protein BYT42DRAFT_593949 [Radiomyces spectabilis]